MNAPNASFSNDLAAAMDWWREAGVDMDFADDVTAWLSDEAGTEPESRPSPSPNAAVDSPGPAAREKIEPQPKSAERRDLIGASPPQTFEEFHRFWLEAPGLDAIGTKGRVLPRGPANADLMVIVVDPEEQDRDRLLSGSRGRLLSRMLDAMGIAEDEAYIASALTRHTPMADTAAIAQGGMDDVMTLHITLAAPKRIVALGSSIPPLLGHDLSQNVTSLREINHDASNTPLLVSEGLDSMMSMPRLKARFWRRWIEWSGV